MNKSVLIRATQGTPTEVVRALAEQGVVVTLNLVRQVQKNAKRKARAKSVDYQRAIFVNHGKKTAEVRRLLDLGFSPARIGKKYGERFRNLAKQELWKRRNPGKKKVKPFRIQGVKFDLNRLRLRKAFDVMDTELPDDYDVDVPTELRVKQRSSQIAMSKGRANATGDADFEDVEEWYEIRALVLDEPTQIIERPAWEHYYEPANVALVDTIEGMWRQIDYTDIPRLVALGFRWIPSDYYLKRPSKELARYLEAVAEKVLQLRAMRIPPTRCLDTIVQLIKQSGLRGPKI